VRRFAFLLLAVLAPLAAPSAALSHGDVMIRAAVERLRAAPVYVHPDAIPTLTPDEAAELRDRIEDAGGGVAVAVLPADALHEARDAKTVVGRIRDRVGRTGTYAVVVGGQFAATSTPDDVGAAEGARLARDAFRERKSLGPTLYTFVELVRAEREDEQPASGGTNWLVIAAAALALIGLVLLAPTLRGLGTAGTMRRARRRSSVG
jgi:hypothetical protein